MTYSKLHLSVNNTEQCTPSQLCTREMQKREKSQEYNYIVQQNMYCMYLDMPTYMLSKIKCHIKQTLLVHGTKAAKYIPYEYVNFQTKISVCIQIT
jgi:hypothetical protein